MAPLRSRAVAMKAAEHQQYQWIAVGCAQFFRADNAEHRQQGHGQQRCYRYWYWFKDPPHHYP